MFPQPVCSHIVVKADKKIIVMDLVEGTAEFLLNDVKTEADGYMRIQFFDINYIVVYGGNHIYFFEDFINTTSIQIACTTMMSLGTIAEELARTKDKEYIYGRIFPFWDIDQVDASSALREMSKSKEIIYSTYELNKSVNFDCRASAWFKNHIPWVEGKEDDGIGEKLTISFTKPVESMLVLNGFVDVQRKHLFKANNRVKKALIKSENFEFEYTFEDTVKLSEINFPSKTEKVELIIKEVYPGTKWNDTVITAIMRNYEFSEEAKEDARVWYKRSFPD